MAKKASRPARKVIFLHIHKTAGMSLRGLFARNYRGLQHFNTASFADYIYLTPEIWQMCQDKVKAFTPAEKAGYDVYKGHMLFGLHEFIDAPADYVTFLRRPVPRLLSLYQFAQQKGRVATGLMLDPARPDLGLGEYPDFLRAMDNAQVRVLAAVPFDLPFGGVTEEHFQMAKANLDQFRFVGLTERFDMSLRLLAREMGWRWLQYVPDNVGQRKKAVFSREVMETLSRINRWDAQLYRHAEERFEHLVASYGKALQFDYAIYQAANKGHQWLHHVRNGIKQRLKLGKYSAGREERKNATS